jgi:hypothetical protein
VTTRLTRRQLMLAAGIGAVAAGGVAELAVRLGGASPVPFGAAAGFEPFPNVDAHFALERLVGTPLPTMSWFQDWTTNWLPGPAADARRTGHDVMLTWQPRLGDTPVAFTDILAGKWDAYADRLFQGVATAGIPVALRFGHEMNGNYFPWSDGAPHNGVQSTQTWVAVWRRLVARQRAIGGPVTWVWCVNYVDAGAPYPLAEAYWPGGDVVDVLGIDVYNGLDANPWRTPGELTRPMLERVRRLAPTLPVWLCEVGCREAHAGDTGTKAGWLTELGGFMTEADLQRVVFFDRDQWRLDTSAASLAAARRLVRGTRTSA